MDRNSVWYQNQNYLSICTTNHKNFGPGGKTRVSAAGSSFRPKNRVFEHLDKILSSPTGLSDEKSFYCGSLWYRLVLIHKKKKFWNRKFFHVGIHQKLIFFQLQKNQCSPLSPQFLMKSSKNRDKNGPEFEETPFHFFDFGQKFEF